MKLNFVFCLFLIAGCLFTSCNKEEALMDYELTEVEARAPYISPQMQEILAMLDTCTTAIPFEKLVPVADSTLLSIILYQMKICYFQKFPLKQQKV